MEKIRVVELFAGVGGFRLGLEQASANFQTVWANQWEPSMQAQFAFDCYERHFGLPEHRDRQRGHPAARPFGRRLSLSGLLHCQERCPWDRREERHPLVGDKCHPANPSAPLCSSGKC